MTPSQALCPHVSIGSSDCTSALLTAVGVLCIQNTGNTCVPYRHFLGASLLHFLYAWLAWTDS